MATIQTAIELQDNFTSVLYQVINSVNMSISAMEELHSTMNSTVDTTSIEAARDSINQATTAVHELDSAMQSVNDNTISATPPSTPPEAPEPQQVQWQSYNGPEVFTTTGVERFQQEVQSANAMLSTLNSTQTQIANTAAGMSILPSNAISDINGMGNRLQAIQERIQQIESNPMNVGTAGANAGLEQLRSQLNQAMVEQENLNRAMANMDVSSANDSYIRLMQTVGETERYIRDNTDEQGQFNRAINEGATSADNLMNSIKGMVMAYATIQTGKAILGLSDTLTSTTARLDMMNDGLQTTEEMQNMIFQSAERARGQYQKTADAVSKLGTLAGNAFDSSAEVVGFMEQVNKQFAIAGTSAQGVNAAMLQLTQAMGSGILRGQEFNAVFQQAPNIMHSIADYMGVPIGKLKDMAAEGRITADIVKAAVFAAADETNAKFEKIPKTFQQIWASDSNHALRAVEQVLQRLNTLANSEGFQAFVNGAIEAMAMVANVVLTIFGLIGQVASFAADNWSWLSPIIYGVAAALAVYYGAQLAANAVSFISHGIHLAMAAAQMIHLAATGALTAATAAATATQYGLNSALYACPLVWIIILIIALIAIIFAVCGAIAKMTGIANTGFGVMTGGINVVIQFFKNLGFTAANIAIGIGNAIGALASNMMAAFSNAISGIQSWFYDLLSTALSVVAGICEALNNLPFVEFDFSGISSAADDYAAKASAAAGNKQSYTSVSDAFNSGMSTFDTFKDGWASDAFSAGASWGDGVMDKVTGMLKGVLNPEIPSMGDPLGGIGNIPELGDIAGSAADTAGNTGAIKDAMDITEEDLKYLRDIAEQETINRFTTAEINIEQTNNNHISNNGDLDGVLSGLTDAVYEAVDIIAEGAH